MERRDDACGDTVKPNTYPVLKRIRSLVWPRGVWFLAIFGLLLVPHLALQQYVYDDAYIHLRMAAHLAQHGQPYFNVGEAVNAGSSPAWTVIVACVLLLSGFHPVGLAILGALISTFGVLAFLSLIGSEARLSSLARLVLGTVYLAITLPSSIGWMETPLALLVASVTLIRYRKARMDAFALAGLLPFIRPELAVLTTMILVHAVFFRKTPWMRAASWTALGAVPFLAYELIYFRTVMPHTVTAKSIVYSLSYADAIGSVLVTLSPPLRLLLPAVQVFDNLPFLIAVLAVGMLVLHLLQKPAARLSFLFVILVGWGVIVMAAYVAGRTFIFPWYSPLYLIPFSGAVTLALLGPHAGWRRYAANFLAAPVLFAWLLGFAAVIDLLVHSPAFSRL